MHWFENLFNVPASVFRDGNFVFIGQVPGRYLVLVLLALTAIAWMIYRMVAGRVAAAPWRILLGLRLTWIALLVFFLAVPALRVMRSRQEVFTAVLVDTSRSMGIDDVASGSSGFISRIDAARRLLLGEGKKDEGLLPRLNQNGKVLLYCFDEEVRRMTGVADLRADGSLTNVFRGIHDMEAELRGMPLGAVVLISDGGRNTGGSTQDAAALLNSRGVPLYVVGVGDPNPPDDYEVVHVVAPKRVRTNSEVEVQVTVRHTGYTEPFDLTISRGDITIATRTVTPGKSDLEQVKMLFTPDHQGVATYRVGIAPGKNEKNVENNAREFSLEMQDDRLPVLYVEGSPRMEYRFLRRALYRESDFRLVGLLRLGDKHFYVQGANDDESFLQQGFPKTLEQLYRFQAIILGDIEAGYFTPDQLNMLEQFVRTRGGGLLMLGGVNSFGLGKYADTPVAKMLPVDVTSGGAYSSGKYQARLTQAIGVHPVLRLSLDPEANRVLWSQAPPLIGITPVAGVKPGALTLLTRDSDNKPVLAVQNYGSGRVAAFTSGGSWYWRMSVPASVEFHEKFWKQLTRWLAVGAKDQLTAETDADVYAPGKSAMIQANVLAKDLQPINDAVVVATVTDPQGNTEDLSMEWALTEEGVYKAQYMPREQGDYRVAVRVEGWSTKPVETDFHVAEPMIEAADAGLKESALREMAKIGKGGYFPISMANALPGEVAKSLREAHVSGMKPMDHEIWDTPLLFVLALGLMTAEWGLRRRAGLA